MSRLQETTARPPFRVMRGAFAVAAVASGAAPSGSPTRCSGVCLAQGDADPGAPNVRLEAGTGHVPSFEGPASGAAQVFRV